MRLRIVVNDPAGGSVKEVEFTESPVRIGRRPGNDLVLRHNFVSEPHARIEFDAAGVRIVDLGSRNGTIVKGKAIPRDQPTPVAGRTQVDIGPFTLIISMPAPGDATAGSDLSSTMVLTQPPAPALNRTQPAALASPPTHPAISERPPAPSPSWTEPPAPSPWPARGASPEPGPPVPNLPIVIGLEARAPAVPLSPAAPTLPRAEVAAAPARRLVAEPLWDLVEESFAEATFLWRLWEEGLVSHARDSGRLSSFVEERLFGALAGVQVASEAAWEPLLAPALTSDKPWPLTVAAHLAVAGGPGREALLAVMGGAEGPRLDALRRGVEPATSDEGASHVEARLGQGGPEHLAALVTLRAFRRRPPGPELAPVLGDEAPAIRAAGLRAARHVPHGGALGHVESALGDPDPLVCAAAAETGLVLGSRAAWMRCRELARIPAAASAGPLLLAGFLGTGRDAELVFAALGSAGSRQHALKALPGIGTAQAAEACLEAMSGAEDAQLAAESFCAITGLDLHAENLVAPDPPAPDEPRPFEEEDLDADLVQGPDDLLPWPDVEGVRRWWGKNRGKFAGASRFILGKPASLQALQDVLEVGSMRRRQVVALELAIRTSGRYDVEITAFTSEQRRQMLGFAAVKDGRSQPASLAGLISRI